MTEPSIESVRIDLGEGRALQCRVAGPPDAPLLLFLHGFPEAAFIWDAQLAHFAGRYRCVAPNLRGFAPSYAPADPALYRARYLLGDIDALLARLGARRPIEALVAHDWGGAFAWTIAAQQADWIRRLVIINSPHPATFLRELQHNPAQQEASAYMNFLCRPDAEEQLAADDYARLWRLFEGMGAADPARPGGGWLTEALRARYRAVWDGGLTGGCNYYRASPLRPPTTPDDAVCSLVLPTERTRVLRPTRVVWGMADRALLPCLLDGLQDWVPDLEIVRVPEATHWIVHERPEFISEQIEAHLASG
jgi:pimeloyl-ACP methyl ester carboxylesterase